ALGFPIVGDGIYGTQASLRSLRKQDAPRTGGPALHLHSREIVVPLYKNRAPIAVAAPVPLPLQERLYACGGTGVVFRPPDCSRAHETARRRRAIKPPQIFVAYDQYLH